MKSPIVESTYPISFREEDTKKLGLLIQNRRSVVLVGMRRVGISNFLRFFLNHPDVIKHYVKAPRQLFIPVDLNDLVEREIFPFWILTLKRIADYVEQTIEDEKIKKKISQLFLDSIQSQNLFLTIDGVRKSLVLLTDNGYSPTLFLIRFDRIIDAATPAFFDNFQGLIDATEHKLSFVFTSVRPLDAISPNVFTKHALAVFADTVFIQPAKHKDVKIIYETVAKKYGIILDANLEKKLLNLVDGYNQYLQFALIILHEYAEKITSEKILEILLSDERIALQSEELWESLTPQEKQVIESILTSKNLSSFETEKGEYLLKTGLISNNLTFFSPLFEQFLKEKVVSQKKENHALELSKKELSLLTFLSEHKNEVCEREQIIEHVWQAEESLGVSDWAIDRLVARLRSKLKQQNSKDEIVTIKTRGYKLIENS